jgi:hypothetical protein
MAIVPRELMTPIGARWTAELLKCADNWSDSELAVMRSELPIQYHAVPLDELRRQWINIRKAGTAGYRVNGHGPSVGSRIMQSTPVWYAEYLSSDHWREFRESILQFWSRQCCLCCATNGIEVHHRHYETIGCESITDCVPLCSGCHELFHSKKNRTPIADPGKHSLPLFR